MYPEHDPLLVAKPIAPPTPPRPADTKISPLTVSPLPDTIDMDPLDEEEQPDESKIAPVVPAPEPEIRETSPDSDTATPVDMLKNPELSAQPDAMRTPAFEAEALIVILPEQSEEEDITETDPELTPMPVEIKMSPELPESNDTAPEEVLHPLRKTT
jgi:hypothetical protein